ncbi:MAG: hypothetical protein ACAI35_07790 [Candidatus Methylacidiphilales bacterium]|nr:hypothetical protein [Candidatus Methylacidiphilales bacterium]
MNNNRDNKVNRTADDPYSRLAALARDSKPETRDESVPPFFAARVVARAMAERRERQSAPVSPWDIVGWKAFAVAGVVAVVAVVVMDSDFSILSPTGTEMAFFYDDSAVIHMPYVPVDVL